MLPAAAAERPVGTRSCMTDYLLAQERPLISDHHGFRAENGIVNTMVELRNHYDPPGDSNHIQPDTSTQNVIFQFIFGYKCPPVQGLKYVRYWSPSSYTFVPLY
jgi:hypothetical protein